ncbi:MAG: ABC transporter substrate-binding protein [Myxococcales bacterium]|nr:ABC transporter substrate-binding protein [Myxococcales bacterium]
MRRPSSVFVFVIMLLVWGCSPRPRPAPSAAPRRVVSLVPSATETVFALGLGDRIVGVSRYDDYPDAVRALPKVGGMTDPSYEAIMALNPDGLIGVQGPLNLAVIGRLQSRGVQTAFPRVESIDEVLASFEQFAQFFGAPERAAPLRREVTQGVARVTAAVQGLARPRVLAIYSLRPLIVAGRGSWVDGLVTLAGAENVARDAARYPTISLEQALAWRPEVLLDFAFTMGDAHDVAHALGPGGSLSALARCRVYRFNDVMFVRQGPRIAQAAEAIARRLHPEAHF